MAIASPRAGNISQQPAPAWWPEHIVEWSRKIAEVANRAVAGKLDAVGSITLTQSSATSTLTDSRITASSTIVFMPTTENAAFEITGMLQIDTAALYVSARADGSATLTHANHASTDRTFGYVVIG